MSDTSDNDSQFSNLPTAVVDDAAWHAEDFLVNPQKRPDYIRLLSESRQWGNNALTVYRHVGDELARRLQTKIQNNPSLLTRELVEDIYSQVNETAVPPLLNKNAVKLYALLHLDEYWIHGEKIRELYQRELQHLKEELDAIKRSRTNAGKEYSDAEKDRFSVKPGQQEKFEQTYTEAKGLNIVGYQKAILLCNRVDELMVEADKNAAQRESEGVIIQDSHARFMRNAIQACREILAPGDAAKYGASMNRFTRDFWNGDSFVLEEAIRRADVKKTGPSIPH